MSDLFCAIMFKFYKFSHEPSSFRKSLDFSVDETLAAAQVVAVINDVSAHLSLAIWPMDKNILVSDCIYSTAYDGNMYGSWNQTWMLPIEIYLYWMHFKTADESLRCCYRTDWPESEKKKTTLC